MLHLTTAVGKPGKIEREKRHYGDHNKASKSVYKPQGRRYIPHGYGDEYAFVPHATSIQPEYTVNGPDWKSSLRYVPAPRNPKYISEIWPDSHKSMRTYPWMSRRTVSEYSLFPEYNSTLRSCWDGEHKATLMSTAEITDSQRFGRAKIVVDKRNGLPAAAPGDKPYQVPEYSRSFHKLGSTLPVVNFGGSGKTKPDTFVPLQGLPKISRETWMQNEKRKMKQEEEAAVESLEFWRPASPLLPPPHHLLHPPQMTAASAFPEATLATLRSTY
ncbi:hypothetical protein CAPTEDRAFT_228022 [Capitella teleta]|uniref:Uncharacterized protein n=1 Tax=Capitella teleta TaxID=283909 RepID=R7VBF9_CAPTE|nr:hypothetical protein CAPTEDRAFT_228022 [Capitella teleta]|eukprot:ELU16153.1 hypothetical protein CAPTEDRAFT_228022 [Capitella teleta]